MQFYPKGLRNLIFGQQIAAYTILEELFCVIKSQENKQLCLSMYFYPSVDITNFSQNANQRQELSVLS